MKPMMRGIKDDIPSYAWENYTIADGWFGAWAQRYDTYKLAWHQYLYWFACRDQFQNQKVPGIKKSGVYFTAQKSRQNGVVSFLRKLEERLNLKTMTRFRRTNLEDKVLWIKPAPFWLEDGAKFSLFSLMCRCGLHYQPQKDNFYGAMRAYELDYARVTMPAIRRFIRGFTKYVGSANVQGAHGWRTIFANKAYPTVRKLLVKP